MWYPARLVHQTAVGPEGVAGVGDGQVADAQLIEHPQYGQAGANRMAALHSN